MEYQDIIVKKKDGIARLVLNRPQALNALNKQMLGEIEAAFREFESDAEVKVVILSAEGRAFCAGDDLKEMKDSSSSMAQRADRPLNKAQAVIMNFPKPVIVAVQGYCFTGALDLVLCCDLIIAAEDALFAETRMRFGVVPGAGITQRLPRIIGVTKAKEMFFTGDRISAVEAERIGLINKVVPNDSLIQAAEEMAQKLTEYNENSVKIFKKLINQGMMVDFQTGLQIEAQEFDNFLAESRKQNK